MNKEELISKLSDIEWEDFEVKKAQSEVPKNSWQTVSAFSNTAGGWLVFGVIETGKEFEIKGVKNPGEIEQDFINTLRSEKFNIPIIPECKKFTFSDKTVLAFYIPLSDKKPVYYNTQANTFIRTGSGDQRATKEEIDAMYRDQALAPILPNQSIKVRFRIFGIPRMSGTGNTCQGLMHLTVITCYKKRSFFKNFAFCLMAHLLLAERWL
ncbi:MAG: ATP-binding protein [Candidatus Woykebacteria bacterium]